jgi:hypothetical protein
MMAVLELPPRLSFKSHVKTLSRYGTNASLLVALSAKTDITLPNAVRDLLIFAPSLSRSPRNVHYLLINEMI